MTTRTISLSSFLGILCIALLLASVSAKVICQKGGDCPDEKACYNYCVFWGFKQYGGRCSPIHNTCCCITEDVLPN
ncbi:hypothetical protein CR513_23444, partial [Mucuna pruriens]